MTRTTLAELIRSRLLSKPRHPHEFGSALISRDEIRRLELSRTDLLLLLETDESRSRGRIGDMLTLLEQHGVELHWNDGRPLLGPRSISGWTQVLDDFDPDVALCAHLYDRLIKQWGGAAGGVTEERIRDLNLRRWGIGVEHEDAELARLLARGVADMHVHLGGSRQPGDAWRRLCNGTLATHDLAVAPNSRSVRPPAIPLDLTEEAAWALHYRQAHIEHRRTHSVERFLTAERHWYLQLFHSIARAEERRDNDASANAERYLWFKHQLWRSLRQPQEGANPGLHDFARGWFRAVPRDRAIRVRRIRHMQAVAKEHKAPLSALLAQRHLRRLELRMSPQASASEYVQFLKGWTRIEKTALKSNGYIPDIAFAIHLQRDGAGGGKEPLRQLDRFDRDTAMFQLFRATRPLLSRRFARIDLATLERDGPARLAAPFFRLLRGDAKALEYLAANRIHGTRMQKWRELHAQGLSHAGFGSLHLGASCHAGEDFGALLIGLKEVADAIEGMQLVAGDSIGHGLALGWDPAQFSAKFAHTAIVPAGELLDALIWARLMLDDCPAEMERLASRKLDEWIVERLDGLYGEAAASQLRGLSALRRYREGSLIYPFRLPGMEHRRVGMLVEQRFGDAQLSANFATPLIWAACPEKELSDQVLAWLQRQLRRRCAEKGIVLELHPSSNIRITGTGSLRNCPTMSLLMSDERIRCAIGTDDPGVFATDIGIEYALVFEELLARGCARPDALALLEQCRVNALESIRWPSPACGPGHSTKSKRRTIKKA